MKHVKWQILLGISLVTLSVSFYLFHYLLFRDAHHIFIYLIGDIAFIPLEVLLVTLIIDRLLNEREKRALIKKMNMVIGAFFSEVGIQLLKRFSRFDINFDKIRESFVVSNDWSDQKFYRISKNLKEYDFQINSNKSDLEDLRNFLIGKRDFLLRLLENPNLLENESFTELLWAVSHLTEELAARIQVKSLSNADSAHLSGDIKRAYVMLILEWLEYMKHLKNKYPYLFSFALRTSPFDPNALPEIK